MLTLFLNNRNKKIYFLNSPSSNRITLLFISTFLVGILLSVILFTSIIAAVNNAQISPSIPTLIISISVLLFAIYIFIIKITLKYIDWFIKKYLNYKGQILRIGNEIFFYKDNNLTDKKILSSESYLSSNKNNNGYQINIVFTNKETIDIASYFLSDGISNRRLGTGFIKGALIISVDDLISKLLKIPLKKEYSDTYDD